MSGFVADVATSVEVADMAKDDVESKAAITIRVNLVMGKSSDLYDELNLT